MCSSVATMCFILPTSLCLSYTNPHGGSCKEDGPRAYCGVYTRWLSGDFASLWSEALACIHSQPSHKKATSGPTTLRRLNARRARQAVQAGQYSKAIQALASSGLAPPSPNVLLEMLTKHPQAPPPSLPSYPVPPPMDLSESIVSCCVRAFPRGFAPGPSGFRASHLREAVLCPSPSLASFVNLLAKGRTPPSVIPTSVVPLSSCLPQEEWGTSSHCCRRSATPPDF